MLDHRKAPLYRSAQWRSTPFNRHTLKCISPNTKTLASVLKALLTLEKLAHLILNR
ncbi:hypothetical protein DFAR_830002 [Desulfarculales bacterium]